MIKRYFIRILPLWLVAALLAGCAAAPASVVGSASSTQNSLPSSEAQPGSSSVSASAATPEDDAAQGLPPYEVMEVNAQRFALDGRFIEFATLPATEAEKVVASELAYGILGEFEKQAALWHPGPAAPNAISIENSTQQYQNGEGTQWIKTEEIHELTPEEMLAVQVDDTPLFEASHKNEVPDTSYEDYVATLLEGGLQVVHLRYENRYTEATRAKGPQLSDGAQDYYITLVPGEDGPLLYGSTHFYYPLAESYLEVLGPNRPAM